MSLTTDSSVFRSNRKVSIIQHRQLSIRKKSRNKSFDFLTNPSQDPQLPEDRVRYFKSVKDYINDEQDLVKFEPTYRLKPVKGKPNVTFLKKHVEDIVNLRTEHYHYSGVYSASGARTKCKIFADQIKNILKPQVDERYRVLVVVNIGQDLGQDLRMKSGFLWDNDLDTWFTVSKEISDNEEYGRKNAVFCVINCFLIYKE